RHAQRFSPPVSHLFRFHITELHLARIVQGNGCGLDLCEPRTQRQRQQSDEKDARLFYQLARTEAQLLTEPLHNFSPPRYSLLKATIGFTLAARVPIIQPHCLRYGRRLTPDITGPPRNTPRDHAKFASVHAFVRQQVWAETPARDYFNESRCLMARRRASSNEPFSTRIFTSRVDWCPGRSDV